MRLSVSGSGSRRSFAAGSPTAILLHPSRVVFGEAAERDHDRGDLVHFDEPDDVLFRKLSIVICVWLGLLGGCCIGRMVIWGINITTDVFVGCWDINWDNRTLFELLTYIHSGLYFVLAMFLLAFLIKLRCGRVFWRYWLYFHRRNWSVMLWILISGVACCAVDIKQVATWAVLFFVVPLVFTGIDIMGIIRGKIAAYKWIVRFVYLILFCDFLGYTWVQFAMDRACSIDIDKKYASSGTLLFIALTFNRFLSVGVLVTYGALLLKKFFHPLFPAINFSGRYRFSGENDEKID